MNIKKTVFLFCLGILTLLSYYVLRSDPQTEYIRHQRSYAEILKGLGSTVEYPIKIRQLVMKDSNRVDRCVSCHVGMEDPRLADAPLPILTHPGRYLKDHDIQKIGCTSCHDGQGRAIVKADAHANQSLHWTQKRRIGVFVQASCVRCHPADSPVMMPVFAKGRDLFRSKGCLGCHRVDGRGGNIGPDLSAIANASPHLKMPVDHRLAKEKFNGDVNLAYIFESVFQPKASSHNSRMMDYHFTPDEALAIAIYLKSFSTGDSTIAKSITSLYHQAQISGKELFATFCNACHGEEGQGTKLIELDQISPAVLNSSFLAIAGRDFLIRRISDSGSAIMPAWATSGGLTREEIGRLADYLLASRPTTPTFREISDLDGRADFGGMIFQSRCSGCHGFEGTHETDLIGPTLSSPDWFVHADQEFIFRSIVEGREHTAMPGWSMLSPQNLADLMAWFQERGSSSPPHDFIAAAAAMQKDHAVANGKARFRDACAACHGNEGEGGFAPSLNSPEMLTHATDQYLFQTISAGRPGTAMGAHRYLKSQEIGWLIAFLRSLNPARVPVHFSPDKPVAGRESRGGKLFARICAQCHGTEGFGNIGPAVGHPGFLKAVTDTFLKEMIAYGRAGTGMMGNLRGVSGTASLAEEEIDDIVAFLRSLETRTPQYKGVSFVQGDITLGRRVFSRNCEQCHGPAGSGGTGPAIGRPGFLGQVDDGYLLGTIARGRSGTEMRGFTAAVGGLTPLTEHEIRSVVRYLRSGADAGLFRPKTASYGNVGAGGEHYSRHCASCHGSTKSRGIAPNLFNPNFLSATSDSYLQATMSLGRPGTAMRSVVRGNGGLVEMDSRTVNNIIGFIREQSAQLLKK